MPTKVTITIDRKHILFSLALAAFSVSTLWPLGKEIWDSKMIYTADPTDWWHVWTVHGPGVMGAFASWWGIMKAYGMVPEDVQQALSAAQQAMVNKPETVLDQVTNQTMDQSDKT